MIRDFLARYTDEELRAEIATLRHPHNALLSSVAMGFAVAIERELERRVEHDRGMEVLAARWAEEDA